MKYLLVVLALIIIAVVHEIGHAIAMLKNGIEIKEISFGFPLIRLGITTFVKKLDFLGVKIRNLKIAFYPLLPIGAFVEPTEAAKDKMENLPPQVRMEIYWSGPFANFFLAVLLVAVKSVLPIENRIIFVIASSIFLLLPFLLLRKRLSYLIFVLYVLAILALFIYIFSSESGGGELIGPVGIVSEIPKIIPSFYLQMVAISLSMGLVNMIPIPPLDGGRIMQVFLEKIGVSKGALNIILILGSIIFFIGIIIITLRDIIRLF